MRTPLFDHSGKRLTLNPAFIRKYFPNGGIRLMECADRTQGLMPPPRHPLGVRGLENLLRDGCDTSTARKALAPGFSSTTCAKGTAWIRRGSTAMTGRSLLTPPWPPRSPPAPLTRAWASSRRPNSTARTCCPRAWSGMTCSSPTAPSTPPWCSGCRAASPPGLSPTSSASRCWRPGTTSVPGFPGQTRALSTRGAAPIRGPRKSGCARSWTIPSPGAAL